MSENRKELATKLEENQERQRKLQKLEYYADIAMMGLTLVSLGAFGATLWYQHKEHQQARKIEPVLDALLEAIQKEE